MSAAKASLMLVAVVVASIGVGVLSALYAPGKRWQRYVTCGLLGLLVAQGVILLFERL